MAKRIYTQSIIKWLKSNQKFLVGIGIPSTLFGAIFLYLQLSGAITVLGYSDDMVCAGTLEDPCYAYMNFTANEDIFLYPVGYDPWGRDEIFEFDPNVKEWKLQRSWGSGWRDIPLNKSCTGTWCGAPDNTGTVTYSVAFREGRTYQLRIVAYKHHPAQTIKWSAFSGEIDPYWESIKSHKINDNVEIKNIDKKEAVLEVVSKADKKSKLILKYDIQGNVTNKLENGVYSVKSNKEEIRVYQKPEGIEYELVLLEKPKSNIFKYKLNSSGLDFYYQPPLYLEFGLNKPDNTCNATFCNVTSTNSVYYRNENIVGSYAVYYSENKKNNEYKSGKAFHIYRPWAEDKNGWRVWGNLSIEQGELKITLPKDFLNKAKYPVVIDPTFGYTSVGNSTHNTNSGEMRGSVFSAPENGEVYQINAYLYYSSFGQNGYGAIYLDSNSSLLAKTIDAGDDLQTAEWKKFTLGTNASITSGTDYVLVANHGGAGFMASYSFKYDSGDTNQGKYQSSTTFPDPASFSSDNNKYSIYANYTTSEEEGTKSINLTFGPDVSLFRFTTCGPSIENASAVPEEQNSTHGIDYVCNNGTGGAGDIQIKLNTALNSGWTWYASNTSISSNLIELTTSWQTIYGSLAQGSCTYIWHKANCSYVTQRPGAYEQYQIT